MKFDIEFAIQQWKENLSMYRGFSEETISELEDHLRSGIEELVQQGISDEEAFNRIIKKDYKNIKSMSRHFEKPLHKSKWGTGLISNYFKVGLRSVKKSKAYSFINIVGLSLGLTCSILILLWVNDELSYDKFLPKSDRLFQVWVNLNFDGDINTWNWVPIPLYNELKESDTKIKNSVICLFGIEHLVRVGNVKIVRQGNFVSKEFLEMFQFPLIQGNANLGLADPNSIVITEAFGKALFGDANPMNKTIRIDNKNDLVVTGVLKDLPHNSSFQFDYLIPWTYYSRENSWVRENENNWSNYSFNIFVELGDKKDELSVENNIKGLLTRHGENEIPRELFLHPLTRLRLHSSFVNGVESGGMIVFVRLFAVIAVIILLIGCINYMNLATARSEHRAREVGIRKCIGSSRMELILQFMAESIMMVTIAFIIALGITQFCLPYYNTLLSKNLFIDYTNVNYLLISIVFILSVGLISGSYPAFYLSHFNPVKVLKGKILSGRRTSLPRKILVSSQFGFSILLIICTIVIFYQIKHLKQRKLGYEMSNLIYVNYNEDIARNFPVIKQELLNSGEVLYVNRSNSPITQIGGNRFVGWPGKSEDQNIMFTAIKTGFDYCKTMGISVIMGRDFDKDIASDSTAVLVNQAGLEVMGLKDPIGTQLEIEGKKRTLIGVIDNVIMNSPILPVKPSILIMDRNNIGVVNIRLRKTSDMQSSIKNIQSVFEKYDTAYPFEYSFVDNEFYRKYEMLNFVQILANLFSLLAIVITGLGLLGLASYSAEQKVKEIGVRKVLGASVLSLIFMIVKEFSRPILITFLLVAPISWFLISKILQQFPIRIEFYWWIIPVTGIGTILFTLGIIITQSIRATRTNPAVSLRSE